MKACSRKIDLAPDVDLSAYAEKTLGFSGADLQALVYNAHLDAVHASLTASSEVAKGSREDTVEKELEFVTFGGPEGDNKVISRAEKALVTKRVSYVKYYRIRMHTDFNSFTARSYNVNFVEERQERKESCCFYSV